MSMSLGHGKKLDPALGIVGIDKAELGPMPDDMLADPEAARVDPRAWFENPAAPFEIEIGSGKGTFLVQQAELSPETNYLGIEWAHEFYVYAADRIRRRRTSGSHTNVRMLGGDATVFLRWRCPAEICRVIHLYFSDPWPKKKHHKKRVIQHAFLAEAWRVLKPGGELRVVTDHAELWQWDLDHFKHWLDDAHDSEHRSQLHEQHPNLSGPPFVWQEFEVPGSAGAGELVGTNFERKFREEGRDFHAGVLQKCTASDADPVG